MEYILITSDNPFYRQAIELRYNVFFKPFNVGLDKVYDDLEEGSVHLVCIEKEEVLGYGRLTFADDNISVISQVVVKEDYHKMGIGKELMEHLLSLAKEKGCKAVSLDARIEVKAFYEKLGFHTEGDVFPSKKTGLPHIKMVK